MDDVVNGTSRIEEIVNLSCEMRRSHGGQFCNDSEDRLEAETGLVERVRPDVVPQLKLSGRRI